MLKTLFIKSLCTILLLSATVTTAFCAELTQRDWMVTLTEALGWSFGLPDEPQDPDYINILNGNRELRFEAEEIYNQKTDFVSVMSFRNFGDFSGNGWLHGGKEPTDAHLTFNLPISGEYIIMARLRQSEHTFKIGDRIAKGVADKVFADVNLGTYNLDAGQQEIIVTLPPGGSIDSISLTAPNFAQIVPADGWQPDAPLTWDVINLTLMQLMKLSDLYPVSNDVIEIEAEDYNQPGTRVVDTPHLGRVSREKWLRAGPIETTVKIPLTSIEKGFYNLTVRAIGDPLKIVIGNHHTFHLRGKAYLDDYTFPALYFPDDRSLIEITLPPGTGIDQLKLNKNLVDINESAALYGLEQFQAPTAQDLDTLTSILAAFGVER